MNKPGVLITLDDKVFLRPEPYLMAMAVEVAERNELACWKIKDLIEGLVHSKDEYYCIKKSEDGAKYVMYNVRPDCFGVKDDEIEPVKLSDDDLKALINIKRLYDYYNMVKANDLKNNLNI